MKKVNLITRVTLALFILIIISCKKDKEKENIPILATNDVSNVTGNTATCGGNIIDDGGVTVTARGVCWSINENPVTMDSTTIDGAGGGVFTSSMTDLYPNTIYFVRAYATNSNGTGYGMTMSFTTLKVGPIVTTDTVINISDSSASIEGDVISDGGIDITSRGVCWSKSQNPNLYDNFTTEGTGAGKFTCRIDSLEPGTTYYVRMYATNNIETGYGEEIAFTTNKGKPIVHTFEITNITATFAYGGGNITNDGGDFITDRGIVWGKSEYPTIANNNGITHDGVGIGYYSSELTLLEHKTEYYVRAFAVNDQGVSYGNQYVFSSIAWEQLSNFPEVPRSRAISFVIDDIAYVGLGSDNNGHELDDIWKYNNINDSWSFVCQFPGGAREYAFAFVIDGRAYIGGGVDWSKAFWEFEPSNNSWVQKEDCPESTGYSHVGFSINNKGYILSNEGFSNGNLYEYNPINDSWSSKSSFPYGMGYLAVFVINQKAYVGISDDSREIWSYEPLSDTWSKETTFPGKAMRQTTVFSIGANAYIIDGDPGNNGTSEEVWEYNTINNAWNKLDDFIYGDRSSISFTINNIGYYGIGSYENNYMWKFIP